MSDTEKPRRNCTQHREEMILLSLKQRLENERLSQEEHRELQHEIRRLEIETGLA